MESIKQSVADLYGGADAALSSLLRQLEERQDAAAKELTAWRALGPSPEAVRVELADARAENETMHQRVLEWMDDDVARSVRLVKADADLAEARATIERAIYRLTHMETLDGRIVDGTTIQSADAVTILRTALATTAPAGASSERDACETVARKVVGLDAKEAFAAMEGGDCVHGDDAITRRMRDGAMQVYCIDGAWREGACKTAKHLDGLAPFSIVPEPSKGGV